MRLHDEGVLLSGVAVSGSSILADDTDFISREVRVSKQLQVQVEVTVPDVAVDGSLSIELVSSPAGSALYDTVAYSTLDVPLTQNATVRKTFTVDTDGLAWLKVGRVVNGSTLALTSLNIRYGLIREA